MLYVEDSDIDFVSVVWLLTGAKETGTNNRNQTEQQLPKSARNSGKV